MCARRGPGRAPWVLLTASRLLCLQPGAQMPSAVRGKKELNGLSCVTVGRAAPLVVNHQYQYFFLLFLHDACAPARLEMAGHRRAPKSASTSFLNNLIYLLSVSMTTGALEGWPLSAGGRKIRSLARRGVGGWLRWVAAALPPPPPPMRCCSTCWLPEAARRLGPRLRMNRNKEIATGGAID